MSEDAGELVELRGGRVTPRVLRVNDLVRRPTTEASTFVATLLDHLERQGFDGAPRFIGQSGRSDLLSYIPGEVPARFGVWEDRQIAAAGALLRSMHDATRGSRLAGRSPTVCHHDPGPNNAVFRDGVPVAWIDFDTAAPGDPLEDVAYVAWTRCIASKQTVPVRRQAEQVRILADAYGLCAIEREVLIDAVLERQSGNARFWAAVQMSGSALAEPVVVAERIAWSRREGTFTADHRHVFDQLLG